MTRGFPVALALYWLSPLAAQYTGAAVCRGCHEDQFTRQSKSAHARSLTRTADHALAQSFGEVKADWAFGAGSQAVTFVSRLDGENYVEHGLTWYPSLRRLAPTPGHPEKGGPGVRYPTFGPDGAILRCFLCHSTGVPQVSEAGEIQPREAGVRCETCHGPGAEHAMAPAASNIVNPKRYTAGELNQLCGSCHRMPAPAGSNTNFRDPWNLRHQPLSLAQSRCFLQSKSALSCLACHDAHEASTRSDCAQCHPRPRHGPRVVLAGKTCAQCHMPVVKPLEGLRFSNHWIGVYSAADLLIPRRK